MPSTRPPNNRSLSTFSQVVEVRVSPALSASSVSTPNSVADDQDPIFTGMSSEDEQLSGAMEESRGRSTVVDPLKLDRMDPRDMSPRRDSQELDQLGAETKAKLKEQAKTLQSDLWALIERVEKAHMEHNKLEEENRFLQEYIGELMATGRVTGTNSRHSGSRLR